MSEGRSPSSSPPRKPLDKGSIEAARTVPSEQASENRTQARGHSSETAVTRDRLLTVGQVAERLGLSRSHVYKQAHQWPFTLKLSTKALRFSELGLEHWVNPAQRASRTPPIPGAP